MNAELDSVEEENKRIKIDEKLKKERKARTIFTYVKSMTDFQKALEERGLSVVGCISGTPAEEE